MGKRTYFVANADGDIAGHDLDFAKAEELLDEMNEIHPNEDWEIMDNSEPE